MACKDRDYKAEYRRRMASGLARGLSKAQARGHPRKGEAPASSPEAKPKSDEKIEAAIREMRAGTSMTVAAKSVGMSPKRLSTFIKAHRIGRYKANRWLLTDRRPRRIPMIIGDGQRAITVPGFAEASLAGQHHNAVGRFVRTGDLNHLKRFRGKTVTDVRGREHPFETDPNALFRFAAKDEPAFHEIYQIVST